MAERGLKSLENWAKRVTTGYKDVNVTNMSSSFRDGLAFCAIIHHYYPDLLDFNSLSKKDILQNNSLAFSTAEKKLGVPALLDAEDMVTYSVPDRLSIITYLSQLHNCFENQNRVNRIKPAVKHVLKEGQGGPPAKVPLTDLNNYTPRSHELCQVCKHRVFILERQIIAGKLYHRTCFRCSKCDTLLKPGAYVESDDKVGTYECAICPKDEKKDSDSQLPRNSLPVETENTNGVHSSGQSTPTLSPIATPKLPTLSKDIDIARNNFLRKGVEEMLLSESDHEKSTDKSSSNESISAALDAASETQGQNFDSGFKEENDENQDIIEKPPMPVKPLRQFELKKTLQSTPFQIQSIKTETEINDVRKPYQSVFTRELLHSTTPLYRGLKSSITTANNSENEGKTFSKLTSNVPFIRSTSYSATSLPRPKTSLGGHLDESTSLKSIRTSKAYSNSNITNNSFNSLESRPRKGSLGTPLGDHEVKGEEESTSKFRSESRLLEVRLRNAAYADGTEKTFSSRSSVDEEVQSPTSVKQLIQMREASIRDSMSVTSTYRQDSRLTSNASTFSQNDGDSNTFTKEIHEVKSSSDSTDSVEDKAKDFHNASEIIGAEKAHRIEDIDPIPNTEIAKKKDSIEDSKVPDLNRKVPDVDSKVPDVDSKVPDVDSKVPDVDSKVPDVDSKVPDVDSKVPDVDSKVPDVDSKVPDVDSKVPDMDSRIPVVEIKVSDVDSSDNEIKSKDAIDSSELANNNVTKTELPKSPDISKVVSETTAEYYPDDLNPFGDEEEENNTKDEVEYPDSLNPFGDSDDETVSQVKSLDYDESKNPFASDDDDEQTAVPAHPIATIHTTPNRPPLPPPPKSITPKSHHCQQSPHLSHMESPTGSVKGTLKKRRAPAAPHVKELFMNTSIDSETSMSSLKTSPSPSKLAPSPKVHKHKKAPPPPPSPVLSNKSDSISSGKCDKDTDNNRIKQASATPGSPNPSVVSETYKRKKRPAPPVPIPRRREIKKIPLKDIKSEMNEIEEKQMDLEKQGRELENLIRDRDKDEEPTVEEEEYIMQLFELVNVKNALFRRQAELMYIKRSQRLEEEQVELEFKIRCLMIKPAHKKTDEDKGLEEKLVQQLLDVVDQRNEIVDTIEKDRRREAEEDVTVQEQMDIKNGDLPIAAEIKEKSSQLKKEKKSKDKKKKKKKKAKEEAKEDVEANGKKGTLRKKWF